MATKKEIADGVAKFISDDLLENINGRRLKFVLCMAKEALQNNPDVIDGFLESPLVANVLKADGGDYDIEAFGLTLKNVLASYDDYPAAVPAVPIFAPEENTVRITAADIDKILGYIECDDDGQENMAEQENPETAENV